MQIPLMPLQASTSLVDRPLTDFDYCDRCGARAQVRATLAHGELYFCGHHAREAGKPLTLSAAHLFDPNGVLNYGK